MIHNKKGGELAINKIIIVVLCILVLLALLMFIFKADILEWLRNLPGYTYNDTDTEIDYTQVDPETLKGLCIGYDRVGFVGRLEGVMGLREQYLTFNLGGEKVYSTKLIFGGDDERDAKIWFLQKDKYLGWDWLKINLLVATVKDGRITVTPELFDLDSKTNQEMRFLKEKPVEIRFLRYLNGSFISAMNQICRTGPPEDFKPAWPGSDEKIIWMNNPQIGIKQEGWVFTENYYSIKFLEDFIKNYKIRNIQIKPKFLYLHNFNNYIQVDGFPSPYGLFRIYPDGSVWWLGDQKPSLNQFGDRENFMKFITLNDGRETKEPSLQLRLNPSDIVSYRGYWAVETNIRLNSSSEWSYAKIKSFINK